MVGHGLGRAFVVDNLVAALEVCEAVFYIGEFATNEGNAVVDELGCIFGYVVFVVHHVFFVYVEECVEHIGGAVGVDVAASEHDERCFLVVLLSRDASGVGSCCHIERKPCDVNFFVLPLVERASAHHAELADGRVDGLSECNIHVGQFVAFAVGEVGECAGVAARFLYGEGHALLLAFAFRVAFQRTLENHFEGPLVAVERNGVEMFFRGVVHVEMQTVYDALHKALRSKDENFVLEVVAHAHAVELK